MSEQSGKASWEVWELSCVFKSGLHSEEREGENEMNKVQKGLPFAALK